MAKDDYFVIVYRILAYLYTQLKGGNLIDPAMLGADGPLCKGIPERYWCYILGNMQSQGYIRGVTIQKAWGGATFVTVTRECEITPLGIEYLTENSNMKKAVAFLKDFKEIVPI